MPSRKKPYGDEYAIFEQRWNTGSHADKLALAKEYNVSYDTARQFILQGPTNPPEPVVKEVPIEPEVAEKITDELFIEGVVATKFKVDLDFVTFDLETSGLDADWAILLSTVIKPFGKDPIVFRADTYPEFMTDRVNDRSMVAAVANELGKHAVVITHYGTKFDLPWLRAKMMKYGIAPLPPMRAMDTYKLAKDNMKISRRRLATICDYLFEGKKSEVSGNIWMDVAYKGSKERLDEIVEHNIQDCVLLENLAQIFYPYVKTLSVL